MAAKDIHCTFKMEEEMNDWFCKEVANMDLTKSSVIRACILLGLDTIKNNPNIIKYIEFSDRTQ